MRWNEAYDGLVSSAKARAAAAGRFAEAAAIQTKVTARFEDMRKAATETLTRLEGPFDLVFIEADKGNYIQYWEACMPKVRSGGLLLADNVLWSGRVLDPRDESDQALAAFNEHVRADARVDATILTLRDGLTLARKV
jgi:predicted O-methyltransferase YrrM